MEFVGSWKPTLGGCVEKRGVVPKSRGDVIVQVIRGTGLAKTEQSKVKSSEFKMRGVVWTLGIIIGMSTTASRHKNHNIKRSVQYSAT